MKITGDKQMPEWPNVFKQEKKKLEKLKEAMHKQYLIQKLK
jgi:hypothetical protein